MTSSGEIEALYIAGSVSLSCPLLFVAYGLSVEPVPTGAAPAAGPREPALELGILGFEGTGIRGTLGLEVAPGALAHTNPHARGPGAARDWVTELANQLLGLVKSRLLAHGIDVRPMLPGALPERASPRREPAALVFSSERGLIHAWLEVEVDAGFERGEPEVDGGVLAGEAVLF